MDEYIKRKALIRWIDEFGPANKSAVINAPAADVAPVVHGQWVHDPESSYRVNIWFCSVCRCTATRKYNYCPNCGAKMKEAK